MLVDAGAPASQLSATARLYVVASPDITQANPFENCDTDYDGVVSFNLEHADFQILDRLQNDLIINYFEHFVLFRLIITD